MKEDKHGARADYEYDQMIEARWWDHQEGICFPATCDWCKDEEDKEKDEK